MNNAIQIARFIVKANENVFSIFMQKKNADGTAGREIQTIHHLNEEKMQQVEDALYDDLMFLGLDPEKMPTKDEQKALPKAVQIELAKLMVKHDNAQMKVVKEWAQEMAEEFGVPVCYMGPANVLAQ